MDETSSAVAADDDEHKQRPPEFSLDLEAVEAVEAVEGQGDGHVRIDGGGAAAAAAAAGVGVASGTLDLHYADPGIVGPWTMRLVQDGLCDGLVERLVLV